jgi:hypothetical protein
MDNENKSFMSSTTAMYFAGLTKLQTLYQVCTD